MSEVHPQYIPCASGTQTQTDVCVQAKGSLVELLGHPQVWLIPEDAHLLGVALIHAAQHAGYTAPNEEF
jgi:hypothetical protein